jgi:hypothetical protein
MKQQHTSMATSILTTKSTYRSLSAHRLSEHIVFSLTIACEIDEHLMKSCLSFYITMLACWNSNHPHLSNLQGRHVWIIGITKVWRVMDLPLEGLCKSVSRCRCVDMDTDIHRSAHRRETRSLYFRAETKGCIFLSDGLGFEIEAAYCAVFWECRL